MKKIILETERLVLRPWRESDAPDLYEYAKDDRVGPIAGWPVHQSIEESAGFIQTVFSQEGVYAVTIKGEDRAIGCIGLIRGDKSNFPISDQEGEVSYWIGVPYWDNGYIPEAIKEIVRYGFEDLNLSTIWCGFIDGNEKSKKAQEKCGFKHHHTETNRYFDLIDKTGTEHVSYLTQTDWRTEHI